MSLYLDASALVPMLVNEEGSSRIAGIMAQRAEGLFVSELAAAEVSSAMGRLVRMSPLPAEAALARLENFDAWRGRDAETVDFQTSDFRLANIFMRRFGLGLRAPDALHAAICQRAGLTLVTLDQRLAVAGRSLGVEVRVP